MNASKTISITQKLQEIIKNNPNTIKACVAQEALEHSYDDIKNFFSDLQQHGCISGMISSLVYYKDTEEFFHKHYEEIIDLKTEFEEATGESLKIPHQVANYLSWFSFEYEGQKLTKELGFEIYP
jgi:hypothetical protein